MLNSSILVDPNNIPENSIIVDNSTLDLLTTCPRAYQYAKLHKRIIAGDKPALSFGGAVHSLLELRYKTCLGNAPTSDLFQAQLNLAEELYKKIVIPEGDYRDANWLIELIMRRYNARYNCEPFNLLTVDGTNPTVELPFLVHIFDITDRLGQVWKVYYSGRLDLLTYFPTEGAFVMDHKTTSLLGDSIWNELSVSPQQWGYVWSARKLFPDVEVAGYVVNLIRAKQPPLKPKNGIDAWWEESFQRNKFYVTNENLKEWEENLYHLILMNLEFHNNNFYPMKRKWCFGKFGACSYFNVCSLPQEHRLEFLNSTVYTDNNWSPLN